MSFAAKLQNSRTELLYLVTGTEGGKPTWYYVMIDKPKLEMFNAKIKSPKIILREYGTILYSGWGTKPPDDIKQKIQEQFG